MSKPLISDDQWYMAREFVARTLVIGALSYVLLDDRLGMGGRISPNNLWEHAYVGMVGSGLSIVSENYIEPYKFM
jgi:hypothetical protein